MTAMLSTGCVVHPDMLSITSNVNLGRRLARSLKPSASSVSRASPTRATGPFSVIGSRAAPFAGQSPLIQQWMRSYRSSTTIKFEDGDFETRGRSNTKISPEGLSDLLKGVSDAPRGNQSSNLYASSSSEGSRGGVSYERSNSSRFTSRGSGGSDYNSSADKYGDRRAPRSFGGSDSASEGQSSGSFGGRDFGDRSPRGGDSYGDRFASRGGSDREVGFQGGRDAQSGGDRFSRPSRFGGGGYNSGGSGRFGGARSDFGGGSRFEGGGRFDAPGRNLKSVDFSEENLPPVSKNFYREDESVTKMSEEEISAWRAEHNMEILGEGCPRPVFEFSQTSFPPFIQKHLGKLFPSGPSPIQCQGWALSSIGRDVIASAQTGSGKTIAFVLPALEHIHGQPKLEPGAPGADQPVALFLAPTRELAMQIHEETKRFAGFYGYRTACVYGGAQNRYEQTRQLVSKPHIVIATPGRLLDFVESKLVNLARVSYVVLDEADRMLDMGFEPQVRSVLGQIRPDRQTLMWSATWPKRVQDLASSFLKSPIRIRIGSDELSANRNVTQQFVFANWNDRLDRLVDIMKDRKGQKMLIFTSTKINADLLADELYDHGHRVQSLHGDKAQGVRTRILNDFKTGRSQILIATDVAARGIDVSDIQVVVNYNMPNNSEDYVHRIGRTGRAGKTGTSISFFANSDEALIPELIPILTESGQEVPTEFSEYLEAKRAERAQRLRGPGGRPGGGYRGGSGGGYRGRPSGGYNSRAPRR